MPGAWSYSSRGWGARASQDLPGFHSLGWRCQWKVAAKTSQALSKPSTECQYKNEQEDGGGDTLAHLARQQGGEAG